MTSESGVWTADDCALVLIDYQAEMVEVIRSEYFTEAPKHTDQVGVADAEKRAAAARGAH